MVALSTPLYPLFGESKRNPLKNREGGGALALGGRRLMMQRNNQPKVGGSSRWYVIAERVGGGARGGTPSNRLGRRIERQKINENEIQHGLTWPPINEFLHNNQPKTGSRDGEDYGGERDEREARWSAISLFFGGGKSN